MTTEELASEITCSMDGGYAECLDMLKALDAASKYIVCIRQMVYSSDSRVRAAAYKNANEFGSDWNVFLMRHEKRVISIDTTND